MAHDNAKRGQPTFETMTIRPGSSKSFRVLTLPVVRDGATVNIVQVAMSSENVEAARSKFLLVLSSSPLWLWLHRHSAAGF